MAGGPAAGLPAAVLATEERRLAAYIGPLARVIVRRAAESARSAGELCRAIAEVIPDPADRASFLAAAPLESRPEAPAPPAGGRRPAAAGAAPVRELELSAAELGAAEHRLAQYIGPLAGILVKKAAQAATNRGDFYARLGASIANQADRAAFLATVPA
jgi:serine/threonine-protein kinase